MVQIKHILHIFLIVALLIGFSSCGKKESNNYSEVSFFNPVDVKIIYGENEYNGSVSFDGETMSLKISETDKSFGELEFTANSETCTVDYESLIKEFKIKELPEEYVPLIIYDFLKITGVEFETELFNEADKTSSLTKNTGNHSVDLIVKETETAQQMKIVIK